MVASPQKAAAAPDGKGSKSSSSSLSPQTQTIPELVPQLTLQTKPRPSRGQSLTKVSSSPKIAAAQRSGSLTKVAATAGKPKVVTSSQPKVVKSSEPPKVASANVQSPTNKTVPSTPPPSVAAAVNFDERFDVKEKIGAGSFGEVKRGIDKTTGQEVAIKMEKKEKGKVSGVAMEADIYRKLDTATCSLEEKGVPKLIFEGMYGDHHVLVMEMLGPNLEKLLNKCKRKFSLKTIIQLAIQLIDRIQFIHEARLLHRDIKPENFVIGKIEEKNKRRRNLVHVLDFGLSKPYVDQATGKHIPKRNGKDLVGTARYVSIRTHDGKEQSRRDDIEAIGHMLIYFMKGGHLPWQGMKIGNDENDPNLNTKGKNKLRYKKIAESKKKIPIEELCKGCPKEMEKFMKYARNDLEFIDCPDYDYLRGLFEDLFESKSFPKDDLYDWDPSDADLSAIRGSHGLKRSPSIVKLKGSREVSANVPNTPNKQQ